jgi:hypothetical protein
MNSPGDNQAPIPATRASSPLTRRFLLGAGLGFLGMWLLAFGDLLQQWGNYRFARDAEAVFVVSLFVAFIVGVLAVPAPLLANQVVKRFVPIILGQSVEEPLVRAMRHPLMRVLALAFIGVWLVRLGFSGTNLEESVKQGFLPATWAAAIAVLMVLGGVVLWRLATQDKS